MLDDTTRLARDVFYVSVGFGVLAFQKAQVRRRELHKQLLEASETARGHLEGLGGVLGRS